MANVRTGYQRHYLYNRSDERYYDLITAWHKVNRIIRVWINKNMNIFFYPDKLQNESPLTLLLGVQQNILISAGRSESNRHGLYTMKSPQHLTFVNAVIMNRTYRKNRPQPAGPRSWTSAAGGLWSGARSTGTPRNKAWIWPCRWPATGWSNPTRPWTGCNAVWSSCESWAIGVCIREGYPRPAITPEKQR